MINLTGAREAPNPCTNIGSALLVKGERSANATTLVASEQFKLPSVSYWGVAKR